MPLPSLLQWPSRGLSVWDRIQLYDITAPCRKVSGGIGLNIDKKKSAGTDWPTVTNKGFDVEPVQIELVLFYDTLSKTNWLDIYTEKLAPRLQPVRVDRRNAVPVYHPILEADGIRQIVIIKRPTLTHDGKQIFVVALEGVDIRAVNPRQRNVNAVKRVVNDSHIIIPPPRRDPETGQFVKGPAAAHKGKR